MIRHLSPCERELLLWLGQEDFSQYGECFGRTLDVLIGKGFAQHHPDTGFDNPFIAKGRGKMFDKVSLTDAGLRALAQLKNERRTKGGTKDAVHA